MLHFNLAAARNVLLLITAAFSTPVIARVWAYQLAEECKFSLGTRMYDLCPLTREPFRVVGWKDLLPDGVQQVEYEITLSGSAQSTTCPDGTWICRQETTHRGGGRIVVSYASIASRTTSVSDQGNTFIESTFYRDDDDASLTLLLDGGMVDNKPAMATIEFTCDSQDSEIKFVEYQEVHGIYSFSWTSPHACAHETSQLFVTDTGDDGVEPDPDPNREKSNNADGDQEGEELLDPAQKAASRKKFAIVMVIIMACMALISALLPFSPFRKIFPSCYERRSPYRITEAHLVQWAQEDTPLFINPDEEATMVNGWYFDGEAGLDEFIPLSLGYRHGSPPPKRTINTWNRRVRDYGTTVLNKAWKN